MNHLSTKTGITLLTVTGTVWLLAGCSAYLHQPTRTQSARLGEETTLTAGLRQLPAPHEKIVAAVY